MWLGELVVLLEGKKPLQIVFALAVKTNSDFIFSLVVVGLDVTLHIFAVRYQ